ncbi:MAG TPA: MM0924 family protein [Pyrinomonadaceae bacterium]|nr:MM0924 family protein [Pyrinomonadaceae bacterium]HNU09090.1 MM0924 family protein [Pyrinomonadaceae bacterium]
MEDFLKQLMGKRVDVSCGASAAFRGDVIDVKNGVLFLRDDDENVAYIVVEKIAVITEVRENSSRPGFVI